MVRAGRGGFYDAFRVFGIIRLGSAGFSQSYASTFQNMFPISPNAPILVRGLSVLHIAYSLYSTPVFYGGSFSTYTGARALKRSILGGARTGQYTACGGQFVSRVLKITIARPRPGCGADDLHPNAPEQLPRRQFLPGSPSYIMAYPEPQLRAGLLVRGVGLERGVVSEEEAPIF